MALALGIGVMLVTGPAMAQDTVRQIVVEGIQRIEPETVRSYMAIQPGDPFSAEKLDQSLKNLFNTGLFADVTLHREGDNLVVKVVENPIINRIVFEGNRHLEDNDLKQVIQLAPRMVYTRTKVQTDVARLLELYRRSGRFAATIDPQIIRLPQNRVNLVYKINEGPETGIRDIYFIGNRAFGASDLRDVISTKETRWWRFLSSSDTYDPDRLTYDRELLRRYYLKKGYADFRVVSAVAELTPDKKAFYITFTLDEGPRYKVGKVAVVSHLPHVTPAELMPLVTTTSGDWYDADAVDKTVSHLTNAVGNLGYAFVDIRPQIHRDREKRLLNITYDVEEGPRVYVERIDITGNVRTLDKVIRREFRLVEGDAFNAAKLRRSKQRLEDLGFFQKVEVTPTPGDAPDQTVIKVDVEEKSTGSLSLGAGYSTTNGVLGDIGLSENNLLGTGDAASINLGLSQVQNNITLSFTNPYFLDKPLAAGFDIFHTQTNYQTISQYNEKRTGFALRAGYNLSEPLRQSWKYTLLQDNIYDVATTASQYIAEQAGMTVTSAVGETLLYDRRNNKLDPTEGWYASLSHELAGFGGSQRYLRNYYSTGMYHDFGDGWVGSVSGGVGYIFGIGQRLRISNRFFLGGDNLRGFATGGVGPRDATTGDSLGGDLMYVGSAEMQVPLGLPRELGLSGRLFTDAGSLAKVDTASTTNIQQSNAVRMSVGTGLAWKSPMGPISIDLGFPILKQPFDKTETLRVTFGARF